MTIPLPRLSDGVISLRPPAETDVDDVFLACQDEEIARFTAVPSPYERFHAKAWVSEAARSWSSGTAAPFVVVDAGTGELLGACGLTVMDGERAEIGYWVRREVRGRGVAVRAVRLVSGWALELLGLRRVDLLTDVSNQASQRVAVKAGFVRIGETAAPARCAGKCERVLVFSLCSSPEPAVGQRAASASGRDPTAASVGTGSSSDGS